VDVFEQACSLAPEDAASWIGLGLMRIATEDIRGALEVRETLLERFGDRAESHLIDGHIRKITGQAEAAAECYRRALRLDACQSEALFNLVEISPPDPSDPLTETLQELRRNPSLSPGQGANVCFALARIFEAADRTEQAFGLYQDANASARAALQSLGRSYDPQEIESEADEWISMFDSAAIGGKLEPLDPGVKLIFIVGLPRSGTTLAERILSSHSHVASGGELPFMLECLHKLQAARRSAGKRGRIRLDDGVEESILLRLREEYLDRLFERDLDTDYVIDKLPGNFAALGLIRLLFPDAIMVHCVRDPIATCWSLYCANFAFHLPYYNSLEHVAHYYKVYARLMRHWQGIFGSQIAELRYEKLVLEPEPTIRELVRQCGLPWEEACLSFYDNKLPIYTASMLQARRPLSSNSVSRWRKYEDYLGPLISALEGRGSQPA
jgi:tetratricopeptide (TPR) repeat protein